MTSKQENNKPEKKKCGTAPNTSLILTDDEMEYINRVWNGSKSAAIHSLLLRAIIEWESK